MYFRNVQNCENTGICVTDVKLMAGCWWWGVGGVLVGCLSGWKLNTKGAYGLSLTAVLKVGTTLLLGK